MKTNVKLFLSLGIGLPFVLVAILWLAVQLKQNQIEGPNYNFIFAMTNRAPVKFVIKDNSLFLKTYKTTRSYSLPEIYIYDVNYHTLTPINYQKPNVNYKEAVELKVYDFKDFQVVPSSSSPDGYRYQYYSQGHLFWLFGGAKKKPKLIKNGKRFALHFPGSEQRRPIILGWIIQENRNDRFRQRNK